MIEDPVVSRTSNFLTLTPENFRKLSAATALVSAVALTALAIFTLTAFTGNPAAIIATGAAALSLGIIAITLIAIALLLARRTAPRESFSGMELDDPIDHDAPGIPPILDPFGADEDSFLQPLYSPPRSPSSEMLYPPETGSTGFEDDSAFDLAIAQALQVTGSTGFEDDSAFDFATAQALQMSEEEAKRSKYVDITEYLDMSSSSASISVSQAFIDLASHFNIPHNELEELLRHARRRKIQYDEGGKRSVTISHPLTSRKYVICCSGDKVSMREKF